MAQGVADGQGRSAGPSSVHPEIAESLRLVLTSLPIVLFATDRDGVFTLSEGRGLERLGLAPGGIVGQSIRGLYGDAPDFLDDFERALQGQSSTYRTHVGDATFEGHYGPLRDGRGEIVGVTGVAVDTTERSRAEARRALFQAIVEQTAESVIVTDTGGRILYVNPAFEATTGYRGADVAGEDARLLRSGTHEPAFYEEIWTTILDGRVWEGQLLNRRRDGSTYEAKTSISPVRDDRGLLTGFVSVSRDVSEEMQVRKRLRQAQKLEAVGRLAGGIAHDFNNLLTAILGYSEVCVQQAEAGSALGEALGEIQQAARRGARLTRQLLAFSRHQPLRREALCVNDLLLEMDGLLRRLVREDVELRVRPGRVGAVWADRGQIEQVMMNLVVNAVDAMPSGGTLTIETHPTRLAAEEAAAVGLAPGEYASVVVSDTGVGMSEAELERVFEPFFTTKAPGAGTGLGLATVHGIVEQSGGRVSVQSSLGAGTRFEVHLPTTRTGDAAAALEGRADTAAAEPAPAGARAGEVVLLVEDDDLVRSVVQRTLRDLGYRVRVRRGGEEALATVRRGEDRIDLLLTDLVMPGMGGRELAAEVSRRAPGIRILCMSGYPGDEIDVESLRSRGIAFLAKPFTTTALADAVRAALDGAD